MEKCCSRSCHQIILNRNIPIKYIQLTSREDTQYALCAFTTYRVFHNGEFLTYTILSAKKFKESDDKNAPHIERGITKICTKK
ncbi:YoaP domain-containing protein [Bacillus gaemokensis]|uniref:YoaP domain-containing protein n=1 Tax=Bacillus gaemokensis TaxID=574375 RepID=UPI001F1CEFFA|nr:YoaP domain-containing protein [Bacillus gaemokensis]